MLRVTYRSRSVGGHVNNGPDEEESSDRDPVADIAVVAAAGVLPLENA